VETLASVDCADCGSQHNSCWREEQVWWVCAGKDTLLIPIWPCQKSVLEL